MSNWATRRKYEKGLLAETVFGQGKVWIKSIKKEDSRVFGEKKYCDGV